MSKEPSIRVPRRSGPRRVRISVVGALALISIGLSGCGDPDDDGGNGDGGGGYVAQELTARGSNQPAS